MPYLAGIDFRFFDDEKALADAYRSGSLDAASGLSPTTARELGAMDGSRTLSYPGATLTTVLLNLRPGHPEFSKPAVRTALLEAIDRSRIITDAFAMAARQATGPIPPASALFDPAADPPVPYDLGRGQGGAQGGRLVQAADGWRLPGGKTPVVIELLSLDEASNPAAYTATVGVTRDWTALGLSVIHRAPAARPVRDGAPRERRVSAPRSSDVTVGLDPDLHPLLASSQTVTGGSNIIGLQDPALDALLVAARGTGHGGPIRRPPIRGLQRPLGGGSLPASTGVRGRVHHRWRHGHRTRPCDRSRTRLIDFGMC